MGEGRPTASDNSADQPPLAAGAVFPEAQPAAASCRSVGDDQGVARLRTAPGAGDGLPSTGVDKRPARTPAVATSELPGAAALWRIIRSPRLGRLPGWILAPSRYLFGHSRWCSNPKLF